MPRGWDTDHEHHYNDKNDGKISGLSVKNLAIATLLLTISITIFMLLRSECAALNYFVSFFFKEVIKSHKRGLISRENIKGSKKNLEFMPPMGGHQHILGQKHCTSGDLLCHILTSVQSRRSQKQGENRMLSEKTCRI